MLLTDDFDAVLPTIVSRCQVVRFAPVTPSRAAAILLLAERTGAGADDALAALAASGGVVPARYRVPADAPLAARRARRCSPCCATSP